jgi:hypothetical protein
MKEVYLFACAVLEAEAWECLRLVQRVAKQNDERFPESRDVVKAELDSDWHSHIRTVMLECHSMCKLLKILSTKGNEQAAMWETRLRDVANSLNSLLETGKPLDSLLPEDLSWEKIS